MRRVRERRLFGVGLRQQDFVIEAEPPREASGYRDTPSEARTLRLRREGKGDVDAIRLTIDGTRVRWEADFPRARRVGIAIGAPIALFIAAAMVPLFPLAPGFAGGMIAFAIAAGLSLVLLAVKATGQRVGMQLEKMLREEALEASNESRLRAQLGGGALQERGRATLAVLEARRVALTEADRTRILGATDEATASAWLARAATATTVADVFGRTRVESGADTLDEEDGAASSNLKAGG